MAKFIERVWACDTITGARLAPIPASAFSYSRVTNDGGSGTMQMNVNSKQAAKIDLRAVLRPIKTTLVLEADNRVIAAGVMGNPSYDRDSGNLSVAHNDLWSIFSARKAIKHGLPNAMTAHLNLGPTSMRTLIKRLFAEAVAPGTQYDLPLLLPADVAGTESRTYYGYAMQDVTDAVNELMNSDGGPDVDMRPQWDATGKLQWAPRIGNLASGTTWEYNLDANNHGLTGVGMDADATAITTNAYIIGEGSEKNTLYRSQPSSDVSYPALERDVAYKTVTKVTELEKLAVERIRSYAGPTQQWSASINKDGNGRDGSPRVQDLTLGDDVRIFAAGDPWLPSWSTNRLIKYSGSLESPFVKLEFQQIGA